MPPSSSTSSLHCVRPIASRLPPVRPFLSPLKLLWKLPHTPRACPPPWKKKKPRRKRRAPPRSPPPQQLPLRVAASHARVAASHGRGHLGATPAAAGHCSPPKSSSSPRSPALPTPLSRRSPELLRPSRLPSPNPQRSGPLRRPSLPSVLPPRSHTGLPSEPRSASAIGDAARLCHGLQGRRGLCCLSLHPLVCVGLLGDLTFLFFLTYL